MVCRLFPQRNGLNDLLFSFEQASGIELDHLGRSQLNEFVPFHWKEESLNTKVVARKVFSLSAFILLIAGLIPKFSALLRTIPQCVLGGAVASVFAGIAMTGIKLLVSEGMSTRNTTVAGLSIAIGMGVSLSNGCLNQMTSTIYDGLGMTMGLENFQSIINNTFASSPVVLATIFAVILNLVLPKDPKPEAK